MLEVRDLVCEYEDGGERLRILEGVSLSIAPGTSTAIVGPSGSGKSTLLYLLAGIRRPTGGSVRFQGQPLEELTDGQLADLRRRCFGFVFQHHFLVRHMTVLENLFVALEQPTRADLDRVQHLLERLGLGGLGHRFPHQLSGGQRQRVAVARALAGRPKILFADEPTASLDRASGRALVDLLFELKGETTLVMVTHDQELLDRFDQVMELRRGGLVAMTRSA